MSHPKALRLTSKVTHCPPQSSHLLRAYQFLGLSLWQEGQ
jgi:hypothetical protein